MPRIAEINRYCACGKNGSVRLDYKMFEDLYREIFPHWCWNTCCRKIEDKVDILHNGR
jgi:hypothetical protein